MSAGSKQNSRLKRLLKRHSRAYGPMGQGVEPYFRVLWPRMETLYADLRRQHQTWTTDVILEEWRKAFEALLGELFALENDILFAAMGGEPSRRYFDLVHAEPRRRGDSRTPRELRTSFQRYACLLTTVEEWGTLSDEERDVFLRGLVDHIRWSPRGTAKAQLAARVRDTGKGYQQAKRELLLEGAALVLARWNEPQTYRDGKDWVKDDEGRRATIVPAALPWTEGWAWFCSKVASEAQAILAEQAPSQDVLGAKRPAEAPPLVLKVFAGPEQRQDECSDKPQQEPVATRYEAVDDGVPGNQQDNPELLFENAMQRHEEMAALHLLLTRLTKRERQVYELKIAGRSDAEVAEELHLAATTVRVHLHNIDNKAKALAG